MSQAGTCTISPIDDIEKESQMFWYLLVADYCSLLQPTTSMLLCKIPTPEKKRKEKGKKTPTSWVPPTRCYP
jgi:hypothetical protein